MKISILGIGTELTDGQIVNRNAQWISKQMKSLGVSTTAHVVVPDERELMLQSLEFCTDHSDIVFVTGGLGPTSDDFTREMISQWSGQALKFNPDAWQHIQKRLIPRGIAVREIQRQQCYFPEGCEILNNRSGTAHGFYFKHQAKEIYVLPGPPKEIEVIWQDFIFPKMQKATESLDPIVTLSWDTIGLGESDVADKVIQALEGCELEVGYRVHMPFVEVKLTYLQSQSRAAAGWIEKLEKALNPITALRNGADAAQKLAEILQIHRQILIQDALPGSFLMLRLFPFCKNLLKNQQLSFHSSQENSTSRSDLNFDGSSSNRPSSQLILGLALESPGHARATVVSRGQKRVQYFSSPYQSALLKEREAQYFSELALIFWIQELS